MGTGDRRGGRPSSAGPRRSSSGGRNEADGLMGRYGDGHGDGRSSRGSSRLDDRYDDRGRVRSSSTRSRADDDRYADHYDDRPASRYDRYPARSRASLRDDDPPPSRRADRYPAERAARGADRANGANGYGRYQDARWDRQGRGAQPPRKNSHRAVVLVAVILVVVALPPLLVFGVWPRLRALTGSQVNTVFPWAGSSQQTAPIAGNNAFASQQDGVDPAFAAYYSAHGGASTLGTPITPGFLTRSGIVQFYASGALLTSAPAPTSSGTPTSGTPQATTGAKSGATAVAPLPGDGVLQLVGTGPTLTGAAAAGGTASGTPAATPGATPGATPSATPGASPSGGAKVVELPVVAALLKAGSQTPVATGAATTYVDLRTAASPDHLVSGTQPATLPTGTPTQPVFIATNGAAHGHNIPPALWAYITNPTVSPAGWQADIGAPLTEAQTVTVTQSGATHHLMIQAFWDAVVVADADTLTSAHPTIAREDIGGDYLLTLGPPAVNVNATTTAWALGNIAVLDAPVSGNATVHIGQNFPLTLTGESKWNQAALWFGASWSAGASRSGKGWVAGASLTFATPDPSQPAQASFDTLSPDLANYLSQQGKNMGVALYDITRNTYYSYNDSGEFYLASTAKVYIMCSYLDWLEGLGRQPNGDEMYLLQTMIENSNNDSAQALFDREGHAPRQAQYLAKLGINGYIGYGDYWGWAQLPPSAMSTVLTDLQQGKILNDSDRKLAFTLMGSIESDQRMGIGVTAPKGATYYMKDGWVPEPDNLWALNSTGIVTVGNESYALAVYSKENQNYDWSMVEHVCGAVGQALTSSS